MSHQLHHELLESCPTSTFPSLPTYFILIVLVEVVGSSCCWQLNVGSSGGSKDSRLLQDKFKAVHSPKQQAWVHQLKHSSLPVAMIPLTHL